MVGAQESGLILVIALMMAMLTALGGSKNQSVLVDIPLNVSYSQPDDATLIVAGTVYKSDAGWNIRDTENGGHFARGQQRVNRFFEKENLIQQTTTASFIAVMAVGMTAIIVLAGIDISIGSIYGLAAMLGAMAVSHLDSVAPVYSAVPLGLMICCCVGAACGFMNGALSVGLRVHPFIITLGTMAIFRGIVFVISKGQTVSGLPDSLQKGFFKLEYNGVFPVPTLIMLFVAVAGMVVLRFTVFGRRVFAVGGNEIAAKYAGIPVGQIKIIVYTLAGLLAGLSACMYMGYFGAAENNAGNGYELKVIAAAVIGGASLSGGRGSAVGAVLGAILVQLIDNAMVILDIDQSYNQIVMGAAIIVAVVIDQTKGRMSGR